MSTRRARQLLAAIWMAGIVAASPAGARAKDWKGMIPGKTSRDEVLEKFGPPTRSFSKGGELSDGISYQADEAIVGALESDFFFNAKGILFRIDVFPAREINRATVLRIYGNNFLERSTKRGYPVLYYARDGMVVYLDKTTDKVQSFSFTSSATDKQAGGT